jgi:hypothetical protein
MADLKDLPQKLAPEDSQDHGGQIVASAGAEVSSAIMKKQKKANRKADSPSTSLRTGSDIYEAIRLVASRCPRLRASCYWAGTSCIATEELGHRRSMDLDFHTFRALRDVRPILAEAQKVFGASFRLVEMPDEFGSGFRGVLRLPSGSRIGFEVLSNYADVRKSDLEPSSSAPGMLRVSLERYLADKVQCLVERVEARDLVDVLAVIRHAPALRARLRRLVMAQDALLLAERLLGWTTRSIREDLAGYRDVDPGDAVVARDLILEWIGEHRSEAFE